MSNITTAQLRAAGAVIRGQQPAAATPRPERRRIVQPAKRQPGRSVCREPGRLVVEMFIRTVSEMNRAGHESHWTTAARRKRQRDQVSLCLAGLTLPALPASIVLTRKGPRRLDSDNCVSSMKAVRDQLAKALGVDDADPRLSWDVRQEVAKVVSVVVEIRSR